MEKVLLLCLFLLAVSCQNLPDDDSLSKQQIIETLKNETRYFCERDLEKWQGEWAHQTFCAKMYIGDVEFQELLGWEEINQFTIDHIKENPLPIPLPKVSFEYNIYLFDKTALVFYSKEVAGSLVRETRFMIKENDQWKIARMQTIY